MLWLVMQHGGSSVEMYPHLFDTEAEAEEYIKDAWDGGAYHCDGPFELAVTPDDEIVSSFHRLLQEFIPGSIIVNSEAWYRLTDKEKHEVCRTG